MQLKSNEQGLTDLDFSETLALRSPGGKRCRRPDRGKKRKVKWFNVGLLAQVLPTYTQSFQPVFLLIFSPYMGQLQALLLAKNRRLRREKIKSKVKSFCTVQRQARQPREKRREGAREFHFSLDSNVKRHSSVSLDHPQPLKY